MKEQGTGTGSNIFRSAIHPNAVAVQFLLALFLNLLMPQKLPAQQDNEYYEILVNVDVSRIGATEIDAVIRDMDIYLSVNQLFDFLKIKNNPTEDFESITGFFISPGNNFEIDRNKNHIIYQDKVFNLAEGEIIKTEFDLYLKSHYFGKIFGLESKFNFRTLSVSIETQMELPLIKEMRQEEIRKNLTRLTGTISADTNIARTYPFFKFGTADWSVFTTKEIGNPLNSRFNLNLGSMILGGEATASLSYDNRIPFSEKQQYYLWRYVNNDNRMVRQIKAGKISASPVSTIYNPLLGVQITNTPTTFRKSFGAYTLSDRTEPGWLVELYVNNVLVDYTKADASGFFSFEVPLVYGNTIVKLKFFGPWGEERTKERNVNIPFNYLPPGTLEYTVSAAVVEDSEFSRFVRADLSYGVNRRITIGTGMEYLSSHTVNPYMPFLTGSLRITDNILLAGEYVHRVKAGGTLSYRLPSNIQVDLKYNTYDKDQDAISYNYLGERKLGLSLPLKIGNIYSYNRLSINQLLLPLSKYITAEWMFSGSVLGVNTNLTTYGLILEEDDLFLYSNLSLAFRLPARMVIMPQAQFSYTEKSLMTAKMRIEKYLFDHAFMNLSFERDIRRKTNLIEFGIRYNFSFAQAGFTARQTGKQTALVQYAQGSLISDPGNRFCRFEKIPNTGRGGIIIKPFLDENANGIRDDGEHSAPGLNLKANAGRVVKSEKDTLIAILGLESYTSCFVELDQNSFYNIAWKLPFTTLDIMVDPNIVKEVDIPVKILGEAAGFIRTERGGEIFGLGRITVDYFNSRNEIIKSVLSENDGYFSYFGLVPGDYYVRIDTAQLAGLDFVSVPDLIPFSIKAVIEGDIVDGLDFLLSKVSTDTVLCEKEKEEVLTGEKIPVIEKDTTYMIVHEASEVLLTIEEDCWAIQLGAFSKKANAERMRRNLVELLGKEIEIVIEGGFYKVRILGLPAREDVDENLNILHRQGYNEFWVISLKAQQQQLVIREITDSVLTVVDRLIEPVGRQKESAGSIQVGAFRKEENAKKMVERLSERTDKQIVIIPEAGYFKVRITEFETVDDMRRIISLLNSFGLDDIWLIPSKIKVNRGGIVRDSIPGKKAVMEPVKVNPVDKTIVRKSIEIPEPEFLIQAGVFQKRTQALKAKRKIESKLDLKVEIVELWDCYLVQIPGFYSREETYKYYPELAGIGFGRVTVIEKD